MFVHHDLDIFRDTIIFFPNGEVTVCDGGAAPIGLIPGNAAISKQLRFFVFVFEIVFTFLVFL
jgi:hypothetical protein